MFYVDELNVQRKAGYNLGHHCGLKHKSVCCYVIWKRDNERWILQVPGKGEWIGGKAGRMNKMKSDIYIHLPHISKFSWSVPKYLWAMSSLQMVVDVLMMLVGSSR